MAYYDALKALWATLPAGDTTAQKLAAVNAVTVAGPNVDVAVSSVVGYLALNGKLAGLQKYAGNPPATEAGLAAAELASLLMCPNAPVFGTSSAEAYATIHGFLAAIAGDANSGLTSADVVALLALAATSVPWWQAQGYTSPFGADDLIAAGGLA